MNKALVLALLLLVVCAMPLIAANEVIVDNTSATVSGSWTTATAATDK